MPFERNKAVTNVQGTLVKFIDKEIKKVDPEKEASRAAKSFNPSLFNSLPKKTQGPNNSNK